MEKAKLWDNQTEIDPFFLHSFEIQLKTNNLKISNFPLSTIALKRFV
jgi:hypothetical protein